MQGEVHTVGHPTRRDVWALYILHNFVSMPPWFIKIIIHHFSRQKIKKMVKQNLLVFLMFSQIFFLDCESAKVEDHRVQYRLNLTHKDPRNGFFKNKIYMGEDAKRRMYGNSHLLWLDVSNLIF